MTKTDELSVADDRLVGADQIARFRGEPVARTRYLIRRGLIPFYREGAKIVASRRALREQHIKASSPQSEEAA